MTDDDDRRKVLARHRVMPIGTWVFARSPALALLTRLLWKTKRAPRSVRRVLWGVRAEPDEFLD